MAKIPWYLVFPDGLFDLEEIVLQDDEFVVVEADRLYSNDEFALKIYHPEEGGSIWCRAKLPNQRRRPARGVWHRWDRAAGRLQEIRGPRRYQHRRRRCA